MKIYINRKPVQGPWGGGNKTVKKLSESLIKKGHKVFYSLNRSDFDILICIDPRPNHEGVQYQDLLNYKKKFKSKIVQRIGDIGTHDKPELFNLVKETINYSDIIIFTSHWAKNIINSNIKKQFVIPNKPLRKYHEWKNNNKISGKIKIVTHHWSNNVKKGFDTYKFIDENLNNKISFTYIGRLPNNFRFKNSNYISPRDSSFLAKELSNHNLYLTASKEEAGANHVLEGLAAGLPIIYHQNGGSIPEYVKNFGISFNENKEIESVIDLMIENFNSYKRKCLEYNDSIEDTVEEYIKLICEI